MYIKEEENTFSLPVDALVDEKKKYPDFLD